MRRHRETPRRPTVIASHEPIEGELIEEIRDVVSGELKSFTVRRVERDDLHREADVDYTFHARDGWTLTRKPQ